jgi:hypothetical protein
MYGLKSNYPVQPLVKNEQNEFPLILSNAVIRRDKNNSYLQCFISCHFTSIIQQISNNIFMKKGIYTKKISLLQEKHFLCQRTIIRLDGIHIDSACQF